ncbi:MAG: TonB-dependent receptor [Acidobacteria bacterium]|nr:TonB-dependent receptor [Acidobacteriota bacterium]
MRLRSLYLALVALLVTTGTITAQTSKGILTGIVRDTTGAVIPNASVSVKNQDTGENRASKTQNEGAFRIEALSPGRYTISVSQQGFNPFSVSNIIVSASVVTSHDVVMTVGDTGSTVTVEANTVALNTENGQLTGTIDSTDLRALPTFSLNPIELATTVPGVQLVNQNGLSNGMNIQVNGARPRANNFLLDGQEINDVGIGGQAFQPQIPDMYSSLAVITSAASAEYGRAGGAVVNMITKAGTNEFHGTVFERYSGSGLDALDGVTRQLKPLAPGTPNPKARYDQHTYGFTLGGPIFKDKLFAFGGLQLQRKYGKETPNRLELPDANGYATLQKIGGPQVQLLNQYLSNGSYLKDYVAFNDGVITNINVGPQNGCPTTGCIVTTGHFQRQNASLSNPDTQWMYRIDFNPRSADNFYFRYMHDRQSFSPDFQNNGSALVGFDTEQGGPVELGAGGWTHVFTPNLLNELRVSEARLGFLFAPTADTLKNPLYALSSVNIANFPALGPDQNFPQGRHEDLYQLQDTVGWTKGRQSWRIGFDIGRILETDIVSQNAKGTLSFVKGGTYISSLGNFLQNQLGASGTATKTFGATRVDPHGWRSGVFAQDDIKLNADLTINLGVRYDYLTNPLNSLQYPGIDPSNPYAAINTVYKVKNDTNNIAPRVGFAYSPHFGGYFGDGKTSIRGGFGVFYDSTFSNILVNSAQSSPNAVGGTLTSTAPGGLPNATSLIPTITPTLNPKSSVTSVVDNIVNPLTYQFNLGVERELPAQILTSVRYVGTLGRKLYANQQYNYFSNGARLNTTRGVINARGNFAGSSYNGLEVSASHGFSHGLQIRGSYTYSKSLDDGSEVFSLANSPTSYSANLAPGGRGQDWGPSSYDHRHYLTISYVWSPVGLHANNTFANAALGALTRHWTISGTEQFQSGPYLTFDTAGYDINGDGSTTNDRAVLGNKSKPLDTGAIDGHFVGGTDGVYYDIAALNDPNGDMNVVTPNDVHWLIPYGPQNQFLHQEIGRNSYANPGLQFHNIAVEKGIGMSYFHFDRGRLILRAEVNNIGNHNNVGPMNTSIPNIGTAVFLDKTNARQGSGDAQSQGRQMYLWAKFVF